MKRVEEMWAYLSEGPGTEERLLAASLAPMGSTALVFTRREAADRAREVAFEAAKLSGLPFRLVRLEVVETIDTLEMA